MGGSVLCDVTAGKNHRLFVIVTPGRRRRSPLRRHVGRKPAQNEGMC